MSTTYRPLTPKAVIQLIAPHSWVAAIAPVAIGTAWACTLGANKTGVVSFSGPLASFVSAQMWPYVLGVLMLITSVALQSAVNTLNDYVDFKKGTDTAENCVDVTDASIIYNDLDPKDALRTAIGCLIVAAVTGLTVVALTDWVPLVIGLVGAVTVVAYSAGPKPISYLPLGEFVSGFVMGELITAATYYVIAGPYDIGWASAFVFGLPAFVLIANIMQTNNTCDIERDTVAGRRTLPILLGARKSALMMAVLSTCVLIFIAVVGAMLSVWGLALALVVAIVAMPLIYNQYRIEYGPQTRPQAFAIAVKLAVILNLGYVAVIVIGATVG